MFAYTTSDVYLTLMFSFEIHSIYFREITIWYPWPEINNYNVVMTNTVPDMRSRDHEFVVVRCTINLGTGNLEWGGVEKRAGRSVYE